MKKYVTWIIAALIALITIIFFILQHFVWLPNNEELLFDDPTQSLIKVHILNVGQADAAIIELPGHRTMMIDIGAADSMNRIDAYLSSLMIRKIDFLVISHFHSDHMGNFDEWVDTHDIESLYIPSSTDEDSLRISRLAKEKGILVHQASMGTTILNENDLKIEILAPLHANYYNENDSSLVVKITYINNKYLFTGDASILSEQEMLVYGMDLDADVIKIAHHGGESSSSLDFLQAVSPQYAVISVGANNNYDMPSPSVSKRLSDLGIKTYRTDRDGTVTFWGNGQRIAVQTEN